MYLLQPLFTTYTPFFIRQILPFQPKMAGQYILRGRNLVGWVLVLEPKRGVSQISIRIILWVALPNYYILLSMALRAFSFVLHILQSCLYRQRLAIQHYSTQASTAASVESRYCVICIGQAMYASISFYLNVVCI